MRFQSLALRGVRVLAWLPVANKLPGFGPMVPCACGCGKKRHQFDASGRERKYLHGHGTKLKWKQYQEWAKGK